MENPENVNEGPIKEHKPARNIGIIGKSLGDGQKKNKKNTTKWKTTLVKMTQIELKCLSC